MTAVDGWKLSVDHISGTGYIVAHGEMPLKLQTLDQTGIISSDRIILTVEAWNDPKFWDNPQSAALYALTI